MDNQLTDNRIYVDVTTDNAGVVLKPCWGSVGCYIDDFEHRELANPLRQNLQIGDILSSVAGNDVQKCAIETIYSRLRHLLSTLAKTSSVRLEFLQSPSHPCHCLSLPALQDYKSPGIMVHMCPWVRRFLKQSELGHTALAVWNKTYQTISWLNTVFTNDACPLYMSNHVLQRVQECFGVSASGDKESVYTVCKYALEKYLSDPFTETTLHSILSDFVDSDVHRRMHGYYYRRSEPKFVSLRDLMQTEEGRAVLLSVLSTRKELAWKLLQLQQSYLLTMDHSEDNHDAALSWEEECLQFSVQLLESGLFRRVYESDAFALFQLTDHDASPRRMLPALYACCSMHHYQRSMQPFIGDDSARTDEIVRVDLQICLQNSSKVICSSPLFSNLASDCLPVLVPHWQSSVKLWSQTGPSPVTVLTAIPMGTVARAIASLYGFTSPDNQLLYAVVQVQSTEAGMGYAHGCIRLQSRSQLPSDSKTDSDHNSDAHLSSIPSSASTTSDTTERTVTSKITDEASKWWQRMKSVTANSLQSLQQGLASSHPQPEHSTTAVMEGCTDLDTGSTTKTSSSVDNERTHAEEECTTEVLANATCFITPSPQFRALKRHAFSALAGNGGYGDDDPALFNALPELLHAETVALLFHGLLLEVSVVCLVDTAVDLSMVVVLFTWLQRALSPLQWSHLTLPTAAPDHAKALLHCPTPFFLGMEKEVYVHHMLSCDDMEDKTDKNHKRRRAKRVKASVPAHPTAIVVDLSSNTIVWPQTALHHSGDDKRAHDSANVFLVLHTQGKAHRSVVPMYTHFRNHFRPHSHLLFSETESDVEHHQVPSIHSLIVLCNEFVRQLLRGWERCGINFQVKNEGDCEGTWCFHEDSFILLKRQQLEMHASHDDILWTGDYLPFVRCLLRTQAVSTFMTQQFTRQSSKDVL